MNQGTSKWGFSPSLVISTLLIVGNTLSASADYPATVISQGPVGYWRLNETTPPPVPENTATNIGSIGALVDGMYMDHAIKGTSGALPAEPGSKAATFNGTVASGPRVRVPYRPEWNVNGPFSVEF